MNNKTGIFLAVGLFLCQGAAFSENLRGSVESIDLDNRTFKFRSSASDEVRDYRVKEDAVFQGVGAFNELRTGDSVTLDAEDGGDGFWHVGSVNALGRESAPASIRSNPGGMNISTSENAARAANP